MSGVCDIGIGIEWGGMRLKGNPVLLSFILAAAEHI